MTARLDGSFGRIREFTLHASHELKTPLTILCGETEIELRDEALPAAQRERAASRLDELRRLSRVVDGLTLLTKADAGQVALDLAPVRLDELVRDSFADAQILAETPGIRVECGACPAVTVEGNGHRLRQLLLNLLDNAIKYNQAQRMGEAGAAAGRGDGGIDGGEQRPGDRAGDIAAGLRPVFPGRSGAQRRGGGVRPGVEHRAVDRDRARRLDSDRVRAGKVHHGHGAPAVEAGKGGDVGPVTARRAGGEFRPDGF